MKEVKEMEEERKGEETKNIKKMIGKAKERARKGEERQEGEQELEGGRKGEGRGSVGQVRLRRVLITGIVLQVFPRHDGQLLTGYLACHL